MFCTSTQPDTRCSACLSSRRWHFSCHKSRRPSQTWPASVNWSNWLVSLHSKLPSLLWRTSIPSQRVLCRKIWHYFWMEPFRRKRRQHSAWPIQNWVLHWLKHLVLKQRMSAQCQKCCAASAIIFTIWWRVSQTRALVSLSLVWAIATRVLRSSSM